MTRDDTLRLMTLFKAAWPAYYKGMTREEAESVVALWSRMLSDLPCDVVIAAAERMISTLKFPPTIADIRESVAASVAEASGELTAGEAWARVWKALSRFGFYRGDEVREALGERLWDAVQLVGGWTYLCTTEDDVSTLSAQFERRYKAAQEQRKQQVQIPQSVRDAMAGLVGQMALPGGTASVPRLEARVAIDQPRGDADATSAERPGTVILTPERLAELQAAGGRPDFAAARTTGKTTEFQPRDDKLQAIREQEKALLAREATA